MFNFIIKVNLKGQVSVFSVFYKLQKMSPSSYSLISTFTESVWPSIIKSVTDAFTQVTYFVGTHFFPSKIYTRCLIFWFYRTVLYFDFLFVLTSIGKPTVVETILNKNREYAIFAFNPKQYFSCGWELIYVKN